MESFAGRGSTSRRPSVEGSEASAQRGVRAVRTDQTLVDDRPHHGADLLVLHERPDAKAAGRHAGLYHFALLHPTRGDLGRAARRLAETGTPIQGASDHGIVRAYFDWNPMPAAIDVA